MTRPYPHLLRAPISEALLDIGIEPRDDTHLPKIESFLELIQKDFSERRALYSKSFHLHLEDQAEAMASTRSKIIGQIAWAPDHSDAIQARVDGFTLNRVKSYDGWDNLLRRAQKWWPLYASAIGPKCVTRCRLRYMNKLFLAPGADLRDYLRSVPNIPQELPSTLGSFVLQFALPFAEGRTVVIRQATQPDLSLLFDIDVFVSKQLDPQSSALWDEFEALREIKNISFFSLLTPKAWEKYL